MTDAAPDDVTIRRRLRWATVAVVAVGAVAMLGFVVVGRINADEGWYLYAGRLAWRGELPYQDFAFTQMPLMPYLYGIVQALVPNLVLGRITSVALAIGGIALLVRSSRRVGGDTSAFVVALLSVAFATGLYNLSLSKTYALVLFCFGATFAALTSTARPERALPLACAAAWAATLARTSSLPLTAVVIAYCLWRAPNRSTRVRVGAVAGTGALLAAAFVLVSPANARFDLLTFHQLLWYDASTTTRAETILTDRIPEWIGDYPIVVAVALAAIVVTLVVPRARRRVREHPALAVMALGAAGYLALQLPAGQFAPVEYATPMVPVIFAISIPVLASWIGPLLATRARRVGAAALLVVAVAVGLLYPAPWDYIVRPSSAGGILHQQDVGQTVRSLTDDGDEVLALWAQPIALASGRDFAPGVTLGPFSYEDLTDREARDLHYVNARRLQRILTEATPAVVVLTGIDRLVLQFKGTLTQDRGDPRAVLDALDAHYRRVETTTTWGIDGPVPVEIFVRR